MQKTIINGEPYIKVDDLCRFIEKKINGDDLKPSEVLWKIMMLTNELRKPLDASRETA